MYCMENSNVQIVEISWFFNTQALREINFGDSENAEYFF